MAKGKSRRLGSEPTTEEPTSAEAEATPTQRRSPAGPSWDGPSLRAARERAGIAIEEMSARTKINIAIIRALEEERFEDTPKARVYVRGFVRCMAEEIGIDPDAVARSYVPRWERWFADRGPDLP